MYISLMLPHLIIPTYVQLGPTYANLLEILLFGRGFLSSSIQCIKFLNGSLTPDTEPTSNSEQVSNKLLLVFEATTL